MQYECKLLGNRQCKIFKADALIWVSHLYSCSVGDSLGGVDRLAQLLAVKEVLQHLLHLGNTGGPTDQHNLIDLRKQMQLSATRLISRCLSKQSWTLLAGLPQQKICWGR